MGKYVVLLRGINVGGVALGMSDFRSILEFIGFRNVLTYIQSGNAVFECVDGNRKKMEAEIACEIRNKIRHEIAVMVLSADEMKDIASSHPLESYGDHDNLYVTVLDRLPERERMDLLLETMNGTDIHVSKNRVVYSYYGEGYGKSKRSNNFIEKMLKVTATTRNWHTMRKILELVS